jgi:heme exporter protein B
MGGLDLLILRDVRRAWIGGSALLPVAFFLLVTILFPFAVGPDAILLARVGGGILWAAALLAALIPVERLVAPDLANGVVDQLLVRGQSATAIALAKLIAHWLSFAPPILMAVLPAAALLDVSRDTLFRVEIGLLVGTPGLAALAVAIGALTATLRGAGALAGLLILPLGVPLLIFGAGSLDGGTGALKLLGAVSLLIVAGAPFVAGAAIRAGLD